MTRKMNFTVDIEKAEREMRAISGEFDQLKEKFGEVEIGTEAYKTVDVYYRDINNRYYEGCVMLNMLGLTWDDDEKIIKEFVR